MTEIAEGWQDYSLIDAGDGEKLERWGSVRTVRPDPQAVWPRVYGDELWNARDMHYRRSKTGGGYWEKLSDVPPSWEIKRDINGSVLKFSVRPTDFKHMGIFPEQAVNWRWVSKKIKDAGRSVRVLNLFAYTGGATAACLSAGADVTHVDAANGMNQWAKENIGLSGLTDRPHRVITDDVLKYVRREKRRGSFYDAVIMDPPAFGRGPSGEVWKLSEKLYELALAVSEIISDKPLFVLLNTYTAGLSPIAGENVLRGVLKGGETSAGEIAIKSESGIILPCGVYVRWIYQGCLR